MMPRNPLYLSFVVTAALVVLIAVATLAPVSGPKGLPVSDKGYHLIAFAALTLPVASVRPRWSLALILVVAVYGGMIELVQPYVGRSREFADWVADVAGAVTGCLGGYMINRLLTRLRRPVSG